MTDVFASYYFRPREGVDPNWAAQAISEEQTTGTWTDISTTQEYVHYLDGHVEDVRRSGEGYLTTIRYPAEIFEPGSIPQYLSVVAGNLFGLSKISAVRLLDVDFPQELIRLIPP